MKFEITEILINREKELLGMDIKLPVISWKMQADEKFVFQKAYQIIIREKRSGITVWDTGVREEQDSIEIQYAGEELKSETIYEVDLTVWSNHGSVAKKKENFETGLLDDHMSAWEGAEWIGAPEYYLRSDSISVFALESCMTIEPGGRRAGIVFGANDERLLDKNKNEMCIQGENYISYVLNIEKKPATLEIYRVGYSETDQKKVPFVQIPLLTEDTKEELITDANKYETHQLRIEVMGNAAYAYIDGICVDYVKRKTFSGEKRAPRQLNPLGFNDVTTYPRLCEVGYFVEKGTTAQFDGIKIRNIRKPSAVITYLDGEFGKQIQADKEDIMETRNPSRNALPMFRTEFEAKEHLASARLYITARGIYKVRINGMKVSEYYFMPGASQYDCHLMYQTYDVTSMIQEGKNGIGVTLSSGWWSDMSTYALYNYNYWGDKPSFLAKLILRYKDGETQILTSNCKQWKYFGGGPVLYSGFFNGEKIDGRKKWIENTFSKVGFNVEGLKKPINVEPESIYAEKSSSPLLPGWENVNVKTPKIVGSYNAPVCKVEEIQAKSMSEPVEGVYIYDLGQEITGIPQIKLRGEEGTIVQLRFGEMLYPEKSVYGRLQGHILQANLREASSVDSYILSQDEEDLFCPEFTFHAFRYIEITGITEPVPLEHVSGIMLSSVKKVEGIFKCSNPLINQFASNVKYSMQGNYLSIPTDCPQRNERMGWTGDTHIFARTATYQADVRNFLFRNMQAMVDLQRGDGHLPNIAPVGGGFGGITYESALIILTWELYQQYGDKHIIKVYYPAMDRWMETMQKEGLPGEEYKGFLGDWLALEETDNYLVWNAFFGRNATYMKKFSEILGDDEKKEKYRKLEDKTRKYWNKKFVDEKSGRTVCLNGKICDTQASYAIGLDCGMFDDNQKNGAIKNLVRKVKESRYTVKTGFFGTGALNRVLSEYGFHEVAVKLMNQTEYPSWLYPITQGATTIWERWNGYTQKEGFGKNNAMNSFNHYSLGSVLSWCYEWILGIQRDEENPGFKHFFLKPSFYGFDWASGKVVTSYGEIESSWKKYKDKIIYTCKIPVNTSAHLQIGTKIYELGSGAYSFEENLKFGKECDFMR